MFPSRSFTVLGFIFKFMTHFELIFYMSCSMDQNSFFAHVYLIIPA